LVLVRGRHQTRRLLFGVHGIEHHDGDEARTCGPRELGRRPQRLAPAGGRHEGGADGPHAIGRLLVAVGDYDDWARRAFHDVLRDAADQHAPERAAPGGPHDDEGRGELLDGIGDRVRGRLVLDRPDRRRDPAGVQLGFERGRGVAVSDRDDDKRRAGQAADRGGEAHPPLVGRVEVERDKDGCGHC
jgi:hypothetical protein